MEETLVADELAAKLFNAQPEAAVWYKPVFSEHENATTPTDFAVVYCNAAALKMLCATSSDIPGQTVLNSGFLDEDSRNQVFRQCLEVWESGQQKRFTYYDKQFSGYLNVVRCKVYGGVLSVARDFTAEVLSSQKVKQQADLLQSILNSDINCLFACEAIRNEKGKIVDLKFLLFNRLFMDLVDKTEDQLNNSTFLKTFPSSDKFFNLNCSVIEDGVPVRSEIYFDNDSLHGWYEISLARLGEDGLVVSFLDVSEKKKDKEAIIAAAENLQNAIDSSQTGITVIYPEYDDACEIIDFRYKIVNQTFSAYIGRKPGEMAGQLLSKMFPSYKAQGTFDRYKKIFLTGEPQRFDLHYMKDGYDVWADILAKKVGEEILVTFHDYTPLKKAQLQLETMVKDLKRSNASLEDFAFAASHDLQEPLRKIHFFADKLKTSYTDKLDDEAVFMLNRMESASLRMRQLIDDLLVYSQINLQPRENDKVDLNEVVQDALADLENTIHEKKASITTDLLPVLKGDKPQLRQLFVNLLSNALKYVFEDRVPFISIRSKKILGSEAGITLPNERKHELFHLIEFSDNGIGFRQEDADKIFNVFQRLHGKNEYSGTGVGLAIVKKVVDNHYGFIHAQGERGVGATFSVLLPIED